MELNMDRFTGLTVFAKVVEAANFAAAGRQLRMSPAMVSKHVQRLEEQLGVRLLNRTTRRVSATEVGQTYYEHCLRILAEMEEVRAGDYYGPAVNRTAPPAICKQRRAASLR